jgi:outer membrane receptor for ferrienterochelin and colicin
MTAFFPRRYRCYLFLILFAHLIGFSAAAQIFKGKVIDAFTGEPLSGASVTFIQGSQKVTRFTELDGSYSFKNVPAGKFDLIVSFIGYEVYKKEIDPSRTVAGKLAAIRLTLSQNDLSEVIVNGQKNRESDEFARRKELTVSNVMNIVSAKAIEISPDITVGNVLQRVSGVSVIRSGSGDGQYAIIRGLDQRYNYTSINNIILPSPDAQTRSVPLDMFPADMIQRVEVIKSLTPNIEANAIGGATNLVMKDAPGHLTISGNLATGISTIFLNQPFSGFSRKDINFLSPTEIHGSNYVAKVSDFTVSQLNFHKVTLPLNLVSGLSIGNQLFHHKAGYLIGGSYIREYRGGNTIVYTGQGVNPDPANTPIFANVQNRQYSYLQSRLGLHGKFNFALSPDHFFNLYGMFLQLDNNEHRSILQNGLGGLGEIDYYDRVRFQRKNMTHVSLNGNDKILGNLTADWTLSYSEASSKTPDWVDLGRFKDSATAVPVYVSALPHQWLHSKDLDKTAYLNLHYRPRQNIEISVGGMYRDENRNSFYNNYSLSVIEPGLGRQQFTNINSVVFSFNPASNAYGDTTDAQTYSAKETVSAAYLQAKIVFRNNLEVLAGVREETTDQSYVSMLSAALPGKTGSFHYNDILPGVHLKYGLTDKQNLRFSYFSGISRPNIYDLVPTTTSGDFYTEGGNPNLKHTTSQNLDFRYENFFTTSTYVLAGVFYKHLVNPIEYAFSTVGGVGQNIYEPTNPNGDATNYGMEVVASKFIGKFGLSGNYSYIQSSVTTPKAILGRDKSGNIATTFANQTRPLQGQANHIGNLSFLYKDPASGFNLQLSLVYTGKRITVVSPYYGLDYWQRASTQLDFSIEKRFRKHFVLFAKATNLLNNKIYQDILHQNDLAGYPGLPEQSNPNRILVQKDTFNQTVLAGVRYKL